jgi:P-type Ca2+ transporter type 2C
VFLELIIDPACSVVFEAESEEANVMDRPPRRLDEPLFNKRTVVFSLLQGLSVLVIVAAVFVVALLRGQGEQDARTLSFTTLIIANIGLILTNRSWSKTILSTMRSPNAALWWVLAGALVFLGVVLYFPFWRNMFHFSTLHFIDLVICLAAGVISILWFEGFKIMKGHSVESKLY